MRPTLSELSTAFLPPSKPMSGAGKRGEAGEKEDEHLKVRATSNCAHEV